MCDAEEFATFLRYARTLQFDESPNYAHLKGLFKGLMKRSGWACDWEFDWLDVSHVSLTGCFYATAFRHPIYIVSAR